eukprot:2357653-Pyramimonas_sp.AAC.1
MFQGRWGNRSRARGSVSPAPLKHPPPSLFCLGRGGRGRGVTRDGQRLRRGFCCWPATQMLSAIGPWKPFSGPGAPRKKKDADRKTTPRPRRRNLPRTLIPPRP